MWWSSVLLSQMVILPFNTKMLGSPYPSFWTDHSHIKKELYEWNHSLPPFLSQVPVFSQVIVLVLAYKWPHNPPTISKNCYDLPVMKCTVPWLWLEVAGLQVHHTTPGKTKNTIFYLRKRNYYYYYYYYNTILMRKMQ